MKFFHSKKRRRSFYTFYYSPNLLIPWLNLLTWSVKPGLFFSPIKGFYSPILMGFTHLLNLSVNPFFSHLKRNLLTYIQLLTVKEKVSSTFWKPKNNHTQKSISTQHQKSIISFISHFWVTSFVISEIKFSCFITSCMIHIWEMHLYLGFMGWIT